MSLDEAIDRFEAERERIIDDRLEQLERHQGAARTAFRPKAIRQPCSISRDFFYRVTR